MDSSYLTKRYQHPEPNILADIGTLAATTKGAIDLSIGDPDFTTPQAVIDASFEKTKQGMTHYTEANGLPELRQAIGDYYQTKFNLTFELPQIRVTVGASHALFLALAVLLNPGDEVIVPEPSFSPYPEEVKAAGGNPVILANKAENGFAIDPLAVEQLITPKTKAVIINSPNNPTGNVMSAAEAKQLAKIAEKHHIFVLADEVYSDYLMPGQEFIPFATYAPDNTVTLGSMSKSYAMTGWRVGYLIGPEYLVTAAKLVNEGITYSAPTPSQNAALYAITHADEFVPEFAAAFLERLTYIDEQVKAIDWLSATPIEGGIYAFIDIRKTGLNSVTFAERLLKLAGIIVVPGLAFGQAGEGFVRVAATQPLPVLKTAFERIKQLDVGQLTKE
ncbi:aspartate aminotransferase [Paucilactobacillus hokkaidonensis JCM 18461]|uniref:Aminotransferase n=2 Tax=Paucilactobacillus hokkaidonensis TaxID=1193095 RepID=A0A0A1H122_9LACO|nr:aminotransferase class I/II-fold pyridoxal phosphate-dependent enzyme [Paucilactobacillus hokkaidonensis]KRO11221.1 aspartate aminotransferase [Paucilactobacillus hokkaidonensis]BAP86416.1 aspartate aminotransferase [Paucilactobacillus hokkaidonensis JCM 18461]